MSLIRTVVADDQPIARERLASFLAEQRDIEVVAACANGREAVHAIEAHRPELVFLDTQMPELDGFGVVASVGPDRMPAVVFVTAYDQFALRAFEVHALDYLLKPFGRQRFEQALERARQHLARERAGELATRLLALVQDAQVRRPPATRIVVRSGARVMFIDVARIDRVEAEGNYVRLHVGTDSYLIRETMLAMEQRLGTTRFIRIHRSRIVNAERVKELRVTQLGDYEAVLQNGTALGVSRHYRDVVQERLRRA